MEQELLLLLLLPPQSSGTAFDLTLGGLCDLYVPGALVTFSRDVWMIFYEK